MKEKNSRVGPAGISIELHDVTACLEVTDEAVKAWEQAPWK